MRPKPNIIEFWKCIYNWRDERGEKKGPSPHDFTDDGYCRRCGFDKPPPGSPSLADIIVNEQSKKKHGADN